MKKLIIGASALALSASSFAVVLDFEGPADNTQLHTTSYGGLTWGTSTVDSFSGNLGTFVVNDDASYANSASGSQHVYNNWGANELWFDFGAPVVEFEGAYFARVKPGIAWAKAGEVRFRDNLGNTSAWLALTSETPTWLDASFAGSTRVYVEYSGSGPQQYTMDDVTFNPVPEPATMAVLGLGALAALRRKRSA